MSIPTVYVYKDGKEVFRYQAGYNDLENKVKLTGNELFNMYSCTKVATAVSGMQLLEKGEFLLDEPIHAGFSIIADLHIGYSHRICSHIGQYTL